MTEEYTIEVKEIGSDNSEWYRLTLRLEEFKGVVKFGYCMTTIVRALKKLRRRGYLAEVDYAAGSLIADTNVWVEKPSDRHDTLIEMLVGNEFHIHKVEGAGTVLVRKTRGVYDNQ